MHALIVAAREIAGAGALDLDHARAEIGELARTERRGDCVFERDDLDTVEWSHCVSQPKVRTNAVARGYARPRTRESDWWKSARPGRDVFRGIYVRRRIRTRSRSRHGIAGTRWPLPTTRRPRAASPCSPVRRTVDAHRNGGPLRIASGSLLPH